MLKKIYFLCLAVSYCVCLTNAKDCDKVPKHYEELGCTVKDKDQNDCAIT